MLLNPSPLLRKLYRELVDDADQGSNRQEFTAYGLLFAQVGNSQAAFRIKPLSRVVSDQSNHRKLEDPYTFQYLSQD
jgi:hypothetical protein